MNNFCLGNLLDINNIQNLGLNNDQDLFLQLAQLQQLQQLGFLNNGGIQSLFSSGLVGGNFNLGTRHVTTPRSRARTDSLSFQAFSSERLRRAGRP
ncbi:hypothetical protein B0T24DRAFT_631766 [Lasiosphaeria ovina]|uniref:Uncharacterized protein n=1 Tax=Lasiosphaeria ovina TaxID=92902 RepID=A0AAE0N4G2_9PEZI|nr:hypothetical protein B0T24DRAFT_631766 [Lasiosphaeria ovina]